MRHFNQFTVQGVIGHLEQTTARNGNTVLTIALYVDDDYQNAAKEWQSRSYRLGIQFFGTQAEAVMKIVKEKDEVIIVGQISTLVKQVDGANRTEVMLRGDRIFKSRASTFGPRNESLDDTDEDSEPEEIPRVKSAPKKTTPASKSAPRSKWAKTKEDNVNVDDLFRDDDDDTSEDSEPF